MTAAQAPSSLGPGRGWGGLALAVLRSLLTFAVVCAAASWVVAGTVLPAVRG